MFALGLSYGFCLSSNRTRCFLVKDKGNQDSNSGHDSDHHLREKPRPRDSFLLATVCQVYVAVREGDFISHPFVISLLLLPVLNSRHHPQ